MKVICNRGALLDGLMSSGNITAARTPKPALQCIKLSAGKDSMTVAATDLEVAVRYSDAQVQVDQPGEVLVPAEKIREIVRESVDDTLSLQIEGEHLHIRGQDSHYKIFTQNVQDFPNIPDFEGDADFTINGGALKQLISLTLFAAAKESTRYAFNGVLAIAKGKVLTFVATDGRRLALARADLSADSKGGKEGKKAIIPAKALQAVEKLISNPEDAIGVQIKENQVLFHTSSATLTSNLVEGQFPPYEDVIPKDCDRKMTGSTQDFLSAVKRASLMSTEDSNGIRIQFTKKGAVISSRSPESGEATVNFACKFDGGDVEIGFNPQFLTEALRVVNTDELSLEMTAANRPGLIKSGTSFLYVIMPVNLR